MGAWSNKSKTHVSSMTSGDFFGSEKSATFSEKSTVKITFEDTSGVQEVLKNNIPILEGEIIDTAVMSLGKLESFFREQITDAKNKEII